MTESTGRGPSGELAALAKSVALLLATGALMGFAHNYLARQAGPSRGLPWIAEEKVLPQLEALQGTAPAASPSPVPLPSAAPAPERPAVMAGVVKPVTTEASRAPETKRKTAAPSPKPAPPPAEAAVVVPPDMNDPMGIAAAPQGDGLPAIPDLGRPLQMQLPAVKKFFDAKAATIVDARDPEEFAAGHIPGAINMPYDQVITDPERIEKFDPKGKPTIVYCGGGTCEVSMNLAFRMVEAGKKQVLVFVGGWPEWQAAGYPAAKGSE